MKEYMIKGFIPFTIHVVRHRVTRYNHECEWCNKEIKVGETYTWRKTYDGYVFREWKSCVDCDN